MLLKSPWESCHTYHSASDRFLSIAGSHPNTRRAGMKFSSPQHLELSSPQLIFTNESGDALAELIRTSM